MKRNAKQILCLLLAALTLSACAQKEKPEDFQDIIQSLGPNTTQAAPPAAPDLPMPALPDEDEDENGQSIFDQNPYDVDISGLTVDDILGEEGIPDPNEDLLGTVSGPHGVGHAAYRPDTTIYPYAGATPIPLNPIDMPTPTPRPDLSFTYATYVASTVGVTFEGPANWAVDESQPSLMILSEPAVQIKDGQQCIVTLSAEPVTSNYSQNDLKTHVNQRLDTLYSSDYTSWKPSYTATRHMMGAVGVYANYTATTADGVEVGGRIHYACIDHVLYGLEIIYPLGFRDDFIDDVFGKIRSTMAHIK